MEEKAMSFEQAMKRLEEIVTQLEAGEQPLEQSLALYEEGAKLMKQCTLQLDQAEQKVTQLGLAPTGELEERPFPGKEENHGF